MEYSKEDLMEAKKQIWGVGENIGNHTIATTYIMSWIDSNIRTDSRQ